ncbi:hypothetical protein PFICI_13650 [Pestalotiopsis fici W106-1]|uniref:Uncharacterized protein n=1 Tax=Pestalotiopsis fici (strain W106-1 / CGMCC3.15140) TaxID=1229662 RepID=W3WQR0_PESFW|nr:uncharacterized protein PFICI_13650 [Pestalotiopsis fici W106-1]ETS75166.1 hypothetical protein PFICI_13650 [Pestalotiopsis fici W106-1]
MLHAEPARDYSRNAGANSSSSASNAGAAIRPAASTVTQESITTAQTLSDALDAKSTTDAHATEQESLVMRPIVRLPPSAPACAPGSTSITYHDTAVSSGVQAPIAPSPTAQAVNHPDPEVVTIPLSQPTMSLEIKVSEAAITAFEELPKMWHRSWAYRPDEPDAYEEAVCHG